MVNTNALSCKISLCNAELLEIKCTGYSAFLEWFLHGRGIIFLSFTLQAKDQEAWRRLSANDITPNIILKLKGKQVAVELQHKQVTAPYKVMVQEIIFLIANGSWKSCFSIQVQGVCIITRSLSSAFKCCKPGWFLPVVIYKVLFQNRFRIWRASLRFCLLYWRE